MEVDGVRRLKTRSEGPATSKPRAQRSGALGWLFDEALHWLGPAVRLGPERCWGARRVGRRGGMTGGQRQLC